MDLKDRHGNPKVKIVGAVAGIIVFAAVWVFVFSLIRGTYAKPSYSLSGNSLTISGQYGVEIPLAGAAITHERQPIPQTDTKTNGAGIGSIEKGYFIIGGSEAYLNVMDENAPDYILITGRNGSKYYLNCATPEETDRLYEELPPPAK